MQYLKFLTCLHGSKVPFPELKFPAARRRGSEIYFVERQQSLVADNIWSVTVRYNSEEILGGKICNNDFWGILNSFRVINEKRFSL